MKKALISFCILVVALGIYALTDTHSRWLLLNGSAAESYAKQLLQNKHAATHDQFMDYTTMHQPHRNRNQQFVIFSKPASDVMYAYVPSNNPAVIDLGIQTSSKKNQPTWQHIRGSWFVGQFHSDSNTQ